jgi:hypothetical protein
VYLRTLDIFKSSVIQCRILSQHPQYAEKMHSLHANLNCFMFSVCVEQCKSLAVILHTNISPLAHLVVNLPLATHQNSHLPSEILSWSIKKRSKWEYLKKRRQCMISDYNFVCISPTLINDRVSYPVGCESLSNLNKGKYEFKLKRSLKLYTSDRNFTMYLSSRCFMNQAKRRRKSSL